MIVVLKYFHIFFSIWFNYNQSFHCILFQQSVITCYAFRLLYLCVASIEQVIK